MLITLLQILCLILVPVMIIFVPIFLYGILFHLDMPVGHILKNIPWFPILLVVGIAALLSLLHTPASVGFHVKNRSQDSPYPVSSNMETDPIDDSNPQSLAHIHEDSGHGGGMPAKRSDQVLS